MCHSMHERITRYIDGAGEVYTMHESLMVISQAVLCVEALVDEIGQSTSCSKAQLVDWKLQGLLLSVDCSHDYLE